LGFWLTKLRQPGSAASRRAIPASFARVYHHNVERALQARAPHVVANQWAV
jgi:hypothetical protein